MDRCGSGPALQAEPRLFGQLFEESLSILGIYDGFAERNSPRKAPGCLLMIVRQRQDSRGKSFQKRKVEILRLRAMSLGQDLCPMQVMERRLDPAQLGIGAGNEPFAAMVIDARSSLQPMREACIGRHDHFFRLLRGTELVVHERPCALIETDRPLAMVDVLFDRLLHGSKTPAPRALFRRAMRTPRPRFERGDCLLEQRPCARHSRFVERRGIEIEIEARNVLADQARYLPTLAER